jgi:hypothetical protein
MIRRNGFLSFPGCISKGLFKNNVPCGTSNKRLVFYFSNAYTICVLLLAGLPVGRRSESRSGNIEDKQSIFINSKPPHQGLFSGCLEFVFNRSRAKNPIFTGSVSSMTSEVPVGPEAGF